MGRTLLMVVRIVLLAAFLLTGLASPTVNVSLVSTSAKIAWVAAGRRGAEWTEHGFLSHPECANHQGGSHVRGHLTALLCPAVRGLPAVLHRPHLPHFPMARGGVAPLPG